MSNDNRCKYEVGQLVEVTPRTWAGINRPGGVGRIKALHKCSYGYVNTLDVKYVVDGTVDTMIELDFVKQHVQLQRASRSRKSRELLQYSPDDKKKNGRKQHKTNSSAVDTVNHVTNTYDRSNTNHSTARVTPATDQKVAHRSTATQHTDHHPTGTSTLHQDQETAAITAATGTRGSTTNHNWSCGAATLNTPANPKPKPTVLVAPMDWIHTEQQSPVSPLGMASFRAAESKALITKKTLPSVANIPQEPTSEEFKVVSRPKFRSLENKKAPPQPSQDISKPPLPVRLDLFTTLLSKLFHANNDGDDPLPESRLPSLINQHAPKQQPFTPREISACLLTLVEKDRIMIGDGEVYKIY